MAAADGLMGHWTPFVEPIYVCCCCSCPGPGVTCIAKYSPRQRNNERKPSDILWNWWWWWWWWWTNEV